MSNVLRRLTVKEIAAQLVEHGVEAIVERYCPDARLAGRVMQAASPRGGTGQSFYIYLDSGQWRDEAPERGGEASGDIIDFIAVGEGCDNATAIKIAKQILGISDDPDFKPSRQGKADTQHSAPRSAATSKPARSAADQAASHVRYANELWRRAKPIPVDPRGNTAASYLYRRGLPGLYDPAVMRVLTGQRHPSGQVADILLFAVTSPAAPTEILAVQRVYLDLSGYKLTDRPKMLLGSPGTGSIRFAPPTDDGVLGWAEGPENALSVTQLYNVPCWSVINAAGFSKAEVPAGLKRLLVFCDNDDKGLSLKNATERNWPAGLDVEYRLPPPDQDFNDVLLATLGSKS